jgi:hypothetical protein
LLCRAIGFADPILLGDRLANFHDQGGGVVVANNANTNASSNGTLQGTYGTPDNGYALLNYALGSYSVLSDALGSVLEPTSPLMNGVASFSATQAFRSTAPLIAGRAEVVAWWGDGGQEPLLLRGKRDHRTLVELNFYPPSSDVDNGFWTGDGALLLRNGLKYSRCIPCGTLSGAGDSPPL